MKTFLRISKYNSNSEPSHMVTDIRYLSSDDELIYYEFKPVRIPETGMMYEDWNCYDSFKIYITDFDALLFKTINSVFPVNDPDPNGYGVQKCFDKCSNNFFSIEDWSKIIQLLTELVDNTDESTGEFYKVCVQYMNAYMKISDSFCIDSNR